MITVGSTDHAVQTDPYLRRSRVIFTFSGVDMIDIDFNLDNTYEVGSLVFFKEDAILRTSSNLFPHLSVSGKNAPPHFNHQQG